MEKKYIFVLTTHFIYTYNSQKEVDMITDTKLILLIKYNN